jgi:hypothetical protein
MCLFGFETPMTGFRLKDCRNDAVEVCPDDVAHRFALIPCGGHPIRPTHLGESRRSCQDDKISSPGMKFLVQFPESFFGDMRVDLGGGDVRMPEHQLNRPQVGPALQKVAGK